MAQGARSAGTALAALGSPASDDFQRLVGITQHAVGAVEADSAVDPAELLPERCPWSGTARRIHETALVLFARRGYHAVSVRDVATEVGVKPSSIYAHVPSKQQILTNLVKSGHEEHRATLRMAMLEAGSLPSDQLAALTRAHVLVHATYPLLTRVANRELGSLSDEHRAEVLAIRLDLERFFLDVIGRGQAMGDFADVDPVLVVAAVGAMGIRVADWWHPSLGLPASTLAEVYAGFALRLVAP